jgi:4-amino-4-deoxy-L-arabinose transferase-like glycosyltransferase
VRENSERTTRLGGSIRAWQILFALLLLTRALTGAIDYDEDQYVAAGVFARHLTLYRDFIFLQAPADPLLLAGLFALTGGWYLLAARVLSGVLAVAVFALTITLARRYGAGRVSATALASTALLSPFLNQAIATARNDILPLTLFLAGLLLYLEAPGRRRRWAAAAGFCIGLAVEAKISYSFAPLILLLDTGWARAGRWERLIPLAAGLAVAALPGLYFLAVTPGNFLFDLLEFHMAGPAAWYQRVGQTDLLGPAYRFAVLGYLLVSGTNASLLILTAGATVIGRRQRSTAPVPLALPTLLLGGALLTGFQPSPSWPMYYAPAAPLLAVIAAALVAPLRTPGPLALLWTAAFLPALPSWSDHFADLHRLARPAAWPGIAVHHQALALDQAMAAAGHRGGAVATLFPIHALDAAAVMPEFASGPFFFRTADLLSPARIAELHGAGVETLETLFAATPPAAILGGFAAGQWREEMDAGLADYAGRQGYRAVPLTDGDLWPTGSWLYLRNETGAGRHE